MSLRNDLGSFELLQKSARRVSRKVNTSLHRRHGKDARDFYFSDNELLSIQKKIILGRYAFSKLFPREVPKGNTGKFRGLSIPTRRDRVVHKAMLAVLLPRIKEFLRVNPSYGVIERRGVKNAILDVHQHVKTTKRYFFLIADIETFFNKVDRKSLFASILDLLNDHSIDWLIKDVLKVQFKFPPIHRDIFPSELAGIPQGCALSPLFADIFLKPFDNEMKSSGYQMFRYIDDFVIIGKTRQEIYNGFRRARKILKRLKLNLHRYKSDKCRSLHISENPIFLGVAFTSDNKLIPSRHKYLLFKRQIGNEIASITKKSNQTIVLLNNQIVGWSGAYSICDRELLEQYFDELNQTIETGLSKLLLNKQISKSQYNRYLNSIHRFHYPKKFHKKLSSIVKQPYPKKALRDQSRLINVRPSNYH